ncbi:electron transport complex subunit D [Spirochaetia bacterium]|nr:electron transport complex subunit D [Spirochaetia bacterium]
MAEENQEVEQKLLLMQSSPHIAASETTPKIMCRVVISLLPVTVFGIINFGISALLNVVVSIAAAVCAEAFFRRITKQDIRIKDCSAVVTGLLLALVIPPSTPLWMTALGAIFAIVVVKEFFGGLGANVFNPALAGRAFMLMSFPAAMTTWLKPSGIRTPFYQFNGNAIDSVTTATPLVNLKDAIDGVSGAGAAANDALGGNLLQTLFIGNHAGCIGETSILLILVGGLFLLVTKTIDWRAPVALICTSFIASAALGMNPVLSVLSGGVVFGAVFMATDYTTTPVTEGGKIIFGIGAGLIAILIRKFGNYPEGASYGILIMNMVVPFLNRIMHKKYGYAAPVKGAKK